MSLVSTLSPGIYIHPLSLCCFISDDDGQAGLSLAKDHVWGLVLAKMFFFFPMILNVFFYVDVVSLPG